MKTNLRILLAVAPIIIVVLGCTNLVPRDANLFEGDNAAQAAKAIKEKVGTDKVNVISVEIRPSEMKMVIRSATDPKEQDEYTYERGTASGPKPVKIHNIFAGHVPHVTDIDEINFAALPATIKQALEIADPEGSVKLVSMENNYASVANPQLKGAEGKQWALTWRIFVEGTRIHSYFWADKNGKLNEKMK